MKRNKEISLGLLSFPSTKTGITPLSNMVEILLEVVGELHLVSGNESCRRFQDDPRLKMYCTSHESSSITLKRIWNYLLLQLQLAWQVFQLKGVDFWIFFIGGDTLILPMLLAKLRRKRVILLFAGSSIQTLIHRSDQMAFWARQLSRFNCRLSDRIILYFESLIKEWGLEKYSDKIIIQPRHYIDTPKFKTIKELGSREYLGYVGRLSQEKGVMNLIQALCLLDDDLKLLICGEGPLRMEIEEFVLKNDLACQVELKGWVDHNDLPRLLNEMRLLVVPSFTEGFPNIILEAMACGTPVLASSAGAIGEIIKDQDNGFLMKDNHPITIARSIQKALNYPHSREIIENGYHSVRRFDYQVIVSEWQVLMEEFQKRGEG